MKAIIRQMLFFILLVCGILFDVFVSRNCNSREKLLGFVKFLKVRDVGKLNKVLNDASFQDHRLFANVARFDRSGRDVRSGVRK